MVIEFMISGSEAEIAAWPKSADKAGILCCVQGKLTHRCCSSFESCGLQSKGLFLEVWSIDTAHYEESKSPAALLVSVKPSREKPGDRKLAESLVRSLLNELNSQNIRCEMVGDDGEYRPFAATESA